MNTEILYFFFYKVLCLATGLTSIYLGYKLFVAGLLSSAGDLMTESNKFKLTLRQAAPGTFFSVVGGFVICFTIIKGFSAEAKTPTFSDLKPYMENITQSLNEKNDSIFLNKLNAININTDTTLKSQIAIISLMLKRQNRKIESLQSQLSLFSNFGDHTTKAFSER